MAKGNNVPSIVAAEHIGPSDTGDNIEAKKVALFVWDPALGADGEWKRYEGGASGGSGSATGLLPFEFDDIEWSGTPDSFGNYPTATVRNNAVDLAVLTFTYDVDGKLTRVQKA